jgi:hypothetical protein
MVQPPIASGDDAGGARPRGSERRPEDHRENGAEGAMETADGIGKRVRVLLDGGGNPRMSELQQQRAPRS